MSPFCPLCGSGVMHTTKESSVCMSCQTSVRTLKSVKVIQPRPLVGR